MGAQGIQHQVLIASGKVVDSGWWHGSDDVQFEGNLSTVCVQGEIVDIVAEGVFDFAADGIKTEDYIGGNYWAALDLYGMHGLYKGNSPREPGMVTHCRVV